MLLSGLKLDFCVSFVIVIQLLYFITWNKSTYRHYELAIGSPAVYTSAIEKHILVDRY